MVHPRAQLCAATSVLVLLLLSLALLQLTSGPSRHVAPYLDFQVAPSGPVAMFIGDSSHYDLDSDQGTLEYAKLLPSGGHTVHITDPRTSRTRPYTVALFHQLRCLGILRNEHNIPNSEHLAHHCLTYLRQTILCRANLRIESVRNPLGSASRGYDAVCPRDWAQLYEAAERNHATYTAHLKNNRSSQ
ncbi:hypothetical protein FPV67DRAFT_1157959 [Lyophyllum atratum]|nr:hypothetical protein FPV67DRAFT_1157959 [Lyophyllum atratum]